jgi:hypothetical protein
VPIPSKGADGGPAAASTSGANATAEDVTGYLREQQITLTYDPAAGTLHAGNGKAAQTITLKAS